MAEKALYFVFGGAVGAVATWIFTKKYYEKIATEEIESVKEYYKEKKENDKGKEKTVKKEKDPNANLTFLRSQHEWATDKLIGALSVENEEDPISIPKRPSVETMRRYESLAETYKSRIPEEEQKSNFDKKEAIAVSKPYVIMPEEVGDLDHMTSTLYYFQDGVLTDDEMNPLEDPEDLIGDIKVEDHFGEFEDDVVYVRNEDMETDFEICADERKFSDI